MPTKCPNGQTARFLSALLIGSLILGGFACGAATYYWYSIGPQPIDTILGFNNDPLANNVEADCGRVTAVAVDPAKPNHWLIGAAQGGIWENTNAGPFWPRTDDQPSLAMGAIAFAPGNSSLVYAGTGEANFRGDAYAGAGLLLSQDGGTHWQMVNTNFAKTAFSHIVVNPANAANLVVATARGGGGVGEEAQGNGNVPGAPPRGIFVSMDGATSFTQVLTGEATALVANSGDFDQQYAGLGEIYGDPTNGVYRTTDGWQTSQLIPGPWMETNLIYVTFPIATNLVINCSGTNGSIQCVTNNVIIYTNIVTGTNVIFSGGRIALAISPAAPNVLYVGIAGTRFDYLADLDGIWVTTNAWAANPAWAQLPFPPVVADGISLPRFWYMFDLLVDQLDPTVVYLAEFNVWRYSAVSGFWTPLADWSANEVHPDNHVMAWVPKSGSADAMLLGNDGGVYLSDPGVSGFWTSLNSGLRITQFYKGAVDPTGVNTLALGGAQDEFTSKYVGGTAWTQVEGGDGGDCAVSSADPLNNWALSADTETDNHSSPNAVQMFRTLDGAFTTPSLAANGISDGLPFSRQFYVHSEKAPYSDDLLIAGTATLWRCTNFFSGTIPAWSANSPTMTDTNGQPVPISAMAFAPSDNRGLLYAFGTEDGQLRITFNAGASWNDLDPADAVPNRYVSGLAFSPANPNILYVTLSGFDGSLPGQPGHLFETTNAFAATPTWTDVSPPVDQPNNCLAIDPGSAANLYVGTEQGVWNSANGGGTWTHYGTADGMPNLQRMELTGARGSCRN